MQRLQPFKYEPMPNGEHRRDLRRTTGVLPGGPEVNLLEDSADQIADREELGALLELQLVALEHLAGGATRPRITQDGDFLLRPFARVH
jgi:hypothetical protein